MIYVHGHINDETLKAIGPYEIMVSNGPVTNDMLRAMEAAERIVFVFDWNGFPDHLDFWHGYAFSYATHVHPEKLVMYEQEASQSGALTKVMHNAVSIGALWAFDLESLHDIIERGIKVEIKVEAVETPITLNEFEQQLISDSLENDHDERISEGSQA